ncbi:pyridoxamine 5'-phosphate oxidase family protein [Actinospica durhamensis]|uniref:Pyridoxamine 5'-phosphate oxidase family protein n=1 Tax=Actinospica durhamensis TaxID=1508375 RepID=A0A941EV61_9ACTN|nr:pyridoxamine 5'-phosphate oxidase family protein [Actinospica durhamensis]MBR7834514.1 pyridoxamine 5'-phosphate oxidase family protein [Actinospica durhamensis]
MAEIATTGPVPTSYLERAAGAEEFAEITTAAELREALGGPPLESAVAKERPRLHPLDRAWLAACSYCLIATSDAEGNCDLSTKGDPAGFVHVLDDTTIAIPERPGNKRADGFHNILSNPHVGLLFLVPGRRETLRINGRVRILRDAPFFDEMTVKGHRPILAYLVDIDTVFFHCQKASMRSGLWNPESWRPEDLPTHATIVKALHNSAKTLEALETYYGPQYEKGLYA